MSSNFRIPSTPPYSEIGIVTIFHAVWQQKALVLFVTIGVTVATAVYAFTAAPEYQVSSVLRPAAINELDELNRSEVYQLPPGDALIKVGASLESYETRLNFFRANQALFKPFERPGRTLEQSFDVFNRDSLKLVLPDPKKSDSLSAYIGLELKYPEGIDGVSLLNKFVNYAIAAERKQIAADLRVIVRNRLIELEGKIDAARSSYKTGKDARIATLQEVDNIKRAQLQDELKALRQQIETGRQDRIAQLGEAIAIAKTLGIEKPTTPSAFGEKAAGSGESNSVMRTEINNQQTPLYFIGVEALSAERTALLQRKSNDFTEGRIAQIARELQLLRSNREVEMLKQRQNEDLFLSGVEPLRAEIVRLKNLGNLDISNMKLATIDRKALEPLRPVHPKKILILAIGVLVGGILGVLAALVRIFFVTGRRSTQQELIPLLSNAVGKQLREKTKP